MFEQIISDSKYDISIFTQAEIESVGANVTAAETNGKTIYNVRCLIRDTNIRLKPEEIVRQLYLRRLMETYGYVKNRIAVEFPVKFGSETKRADIVIRDKDHPESAYIIIELKKPKLKDGKDQLKSYCHATGAPIGVWTNGGAISYYHRKDPNYFVELTDIPAQAETLADVLREDFRMADLVKKFNEQTERKSLRQRIEEMEDEVLANAGVDVFEEVFKLIFTKLFDELESTRNATRQLQFRNTGQTEAELNQKIQTLFDRAKNKWEDVFSDSDKINLSRSHPFVRVSSLQDYYS